MNLSPSWACASVSFTMPLITTVPCDTFAFLNCTTLATWLTDFNKGNLIPRGCSPFAYRRAIEAEILWRRQRPEAKVPIDPRWEPLSR